MLAMAKASQSGARQRGGGNDRMRNDGGNQMGGNQMGGAEMVGTQTGRNTQMGGYSEMNGGAEMRRRRDSRGRYMEQNGGSRMEYGGEMAYRPMPEPHNPPYLDNNGMNDANTRSVGRSNVVDFGEYQDRRQIGFGMNTENRGEGDMRQYGRRYDPSRMASHQSQKQPQEMGYAQHSESDEEHLTREEAEKWVKGMKSEDGKTGARWPYQEIKQYAGNFGIHGEEQVIEFFAVMNALYTDYGKVAKKYGVDKVDFWADLAKAFIHDKDAEPGKVKLYYECIAKKEDD